MEGGVGSAPAGGEKFNFGFLSGNALKILACLLMLTDHIGMILFPGVSALRAAGRLSMPIFAFMFAEGCHYTRHKTRHFALVFALGLVTSAGISLVNERAEGNILITFSLSCLIIYSLALLKGAAFAHRPKAVAASSAALALSLGASVYLCCFSPVHIEYGLAGALLPVTVRLSDFKSYGASGLLAELYTPATAFLLFFVGLVALTAALGGSQAYCLIAIVPLLMYSGKRGRLRLKYLFYAFYPAHLAVLYAIYFIASPALAFAFA